MEISKQIREEMDVFCQNIKTLRERHCLSKKEMAKILGIGVKSLTKIEQGIIPTRASTNIIFHLSHCFDVQPHNLFKPL